MAENRVLASGRTRLRSWKRLLRIPVRYQSLLWGGLVIGVCALLTLTVTSTFWNPKETYQLGEVAPYSVRAHNDFKVIDTAATFQAKERAALEVPPVYFLAEEIPHIVLRNLGMAFEKCQHKERQECQRGFLEITGINPPEKALTFLEHAKDPQEIKECVANELRRLYASSFIRSESSTPTDDTPSRKAHTLHLRDGKEFDVSSSRFIGIDQARLRLQDRLIASLPEDAPGKIEFAEYISGLILPNVYFDQERTLLRKKAMYERTPPVMKTISKGEIIVHQGEVIYPEQLEKLRKNAQSSPELALPYLMGTSLLLFLLLLFALKTTTILDVRNGLKTKDILYTLLFLLVSIGSLSLLRDILIKALEIPPKNLFMHFSLITVLPLSLAPILVRSVFGPKESFAFLTLYSLLIGWFLPPAPYAALYTFLTGCTLLIGFSRVESRKGFFRLGKQAALMGMAITGIIALIGGFPTPETVSLKELTFGLISVNAGNWLPPILALGLLPLIESMFGFTTTLSLIELSSMEHPLLKKLAMLAPGTYSHSLTVSVLADRAAKEIGANALLVRVGTYFHDIGKMVRPSYFVENQGPHKINPHDRLSPSLSALIIKAHVKEGIELARLYRLPEAVIRMIPEHHGTTLIKSFYDKGKLLDPGVQESDFRYPGPKPRSKEGGVLMLADTLEASSRTLPEFSLPRIQGLVQRTIRTKFLDGQLDECDMTLKDLHAIARSFIQTLASIYHGRIRYEPQERQETHPKRSDHIGVGKPQNVPRLALKDAQDYDEAALKRLGL